MNDKVTHMNKTPRQIAEEELDEERRKESVKRLKEKLRSLENARQVVRNLEREVKELEHEIENGL